MMLARLRGQTGNNLGYTSLEAAPSGDVRTVYVVLLAEGRTTCPPRASSTVTMPGGNAFCPLP